MLSEYTRQVLCRKLKWKELFLCALVIVVFVAALVQKDYFMAALFAICLVVLVFVMVFAPSRTVKQLKEDRSRIHNGENVETVVQFGEEITVSEGVSSFTVAYARILSIHYLSHCCVLKFSKSSGIMLDPNGFTLGDFASFQTFIQEKCQNAAIYNN